MKSWLGTLALAFALWVVGTVVMSCNLEVSND